MSRGRATRLPLWFVEGMAEYLSLGPVHAQTALWLRDAAMREELPGFDDLTNPRFFPYRFGHAAWAYIAGRWGDAAVRDLFLAASRSGNPLDTLQQLAQTDIESLSQAWHQSVFATYGRLVKADAAPRGRAVITEENGGGRLNIGPALSPDGGRVVFLSERELFSIEMFLADARTGEVIRKFTELATNPHFDSIEFLQSTGAWDAEGRRFVYPAVHAADPQFVIVDAASGDTLRTIALPDIGEAINPTWSPDGRYLAFSGLTGGVSDLFIYDLRESRLEQVTNDLFTQIQPRWSPDGRSIALVTDEFSTTLDSLEFGDYRLALYDVSSRTIRPLDGFDGAKNINPQWSPSSDALYFLADPNGIPNVFRLTLADDSISPITSVATGVTGITETSPALAVAASSGDVAFTFFRDGKYEIHMLDRPIADSSIVLQRENAAVLPPPGRGSSEIAGLLRTPTAGLPPPRAFPVTNYDPNLSLEYIGAAASTGFGASSLGTFTGGGLALVFSDMLNFHEVTGVVEANAQRLEDIGGQLSYLNQRTRWNWGGGVQWLPYASGSFSQSVGQIDGSTVVVEQERLLRQVDRQVVGIAEYPFNRAARLEFGGGLRSIGFDREVTTRIFSAQTGQLLQDNTTDLDAPATLNLAQATSAFVYDTSIFGGTSPVLGTRSRLELTPTFGGLNFTQALADTRHYMVPVRPLTIAGRVLHYGRYGADGEDERLAPLFLGYPNLVRGYELGSFSSAECRPDGVSDCPAFDRLMGSRLVVANVELRFPLVGIFQGEFNYGPIPIEGFVFGDAGRTWTSSSEPASLVADRRWVRSAGAGVRVNTFGYAVLEFAAVRPFDRPDDGWRFVFNIVPGF
jgi:Tol biopolymer transport system component